MYSKPSVTKHIIPAEIQYMCRHANDLVSDGHFQQAIEYIDQMISGVPDFACFWLHKGVALEGLNRTNDALTCYEKAIQIDPYNSEAWFNRGVALRKAGREQESDKCQKVASCLEQGREVGSYVTAQPSVALPR
jgi:tetratricopeptide (TPR) repeat protein